MEQIRRQSVLIRHEKRVGGRVAQSKKINRSIQAAVQFKVYIKMLCRVGDRVPLPHKKTIWIVKYNSNNLNHYCLTKESEKSQCSFESIL